MRLHFFHNRLSIALIAGVALGGLLAGVAAFRRPNRYTSSAAVRTSPSRPARELETIVTSRAALREVIEKEGLYPELVARLPMEDVVERMRRDVDLRCINSDDLATVRFAYENAALAQRANVDLVSKASATGLEVVSAPSFPEHPEHPSRLEMIGLGVLAGLLAASAAAGARRSVRFKLSLASAVTGGLLAALLSLALPRTYVSYSRMAVKGEPPPSRAAAWDYWKSVAQTGLGDPALARIATTPSLGLASGSQKSVPEWIRELRGRIDVQGTCPGEFLIAFRYGSPTQAQKINAQLITSIIEEAYRLQHQPAVESGRPLDEGASAVRGERGLLRAGIDGLDVGERNPPVTLLASSLASAPLARSMNPSTDVSPRTLLKPAQKTLVPGIPGIEVVSPASLPDSAESPNTLNIVLAGMMVGLLAGLVVAAGRRGLSV